MVFSSNMSHSLFVVCGITVHIKVHKTISNYCSTAESPLSC